MRKVPKGRFTLDTGLPDVQTTCWWRRLPVLLPFVSYTRKLSKDWKEGEFPSGHKLFLLFGASRSWEFGYHEELSKIAEEMPWLTFVPTVSRPWEDQKWTGEKGRVDDLLRKYADMWGIRADNSVAYLCGHPEMIERGKGVLKRIGFEREFLKEEIYWIPAK